MTAPVSSQARVQAVLDFADMDRQFAQRLEQSTRQAERVVTRNLSGITRAAQASQADINRAFDRITLDIDTRDWSRDMNGVSRDARRTASDVDSAADDMADSMDRAGDSAGGFGDRMRTMGAQAGAAVAGVLAIGGAMDVVAEAMNRADLANKLGAQLDLTAAESAEAGRIAGSIYAQNYGESFEGVTEAAGAVMSSLGNLADDGSAGIENLTKRVLTLSDTFGLEAAEIASSANIMVRNGFAKDAVEAMDLIGASFQRVPAQMRDELLPLVDEYGTFFSSLGFTGQQAMGTLVNASYEGAIAMDKVGDALKETGIRATDLGDTGAVEALEAIGLGSANIQARLLEGGASARTAFGEMVNGLLAIEDPAEQAAQAVALFGTPLEDLNKAEIPAFLQALSYGGDAMGGFEGSVDRMAEHLASGPGAQLELFKRQVQDTLINGLGAAAGYVLEHQTMFRNLAIALGAVVVAYGLVRAAAVAQAVAMGISTAATGGNTAALAANRVALGAYAVAQLAMRGATLAGAAATGIATAATWAFGAAMAVVTSPITLVVLAIGAIIAALVLLYNKNETFRNFVQAAWAGIQAAVGATWEFLKGVFAGIAGWFTGSLIPTLQSWWSVAVQVFQAVGAVIGYFWDNFASPILNNFRWLIMDVIVPAVLWLWQNVIAPAFGAIGAIIGAWWTGVVEPAFGGAKAAIGFVGDVLMWLWQTVFVPAFSAIGSTLSGWWSTAQGIFDQAKTGIGVLGDAFGAAGRVMSGIWDGIVAAMRPAVHFIGRALSAVPTSLGPIEIPGAGVANDLGNKLQQFRAGGLAIGPGTGTSDSILAAISNGEFVTRAAAVAKWLPLLEAINSGAGPAQVLATLLSLLPGFAGGGLVNVDQLRDFARGIEGAEYVWGGWGNGWATDCSGAASALANYVKTQVPAGQGERSGTAGMAGFLSDLGAQPGLGPNGSLQWGWYNGGPYGGHIAMTLPTGENVEMGGERGNGQFGGAAKAANDPAFSEHMHFPPEFFDGGDLGGGGGIGTGGAGAALGGSGGAFSGGFGGSGAGGSGAGGSSSGTPGGGGDGTRVFVTNWPPGGLSPSTAGTPAGAPTPAPAGTGTGGSLATGTPGTVAGAPQSGVAAANAWAAEQDFPGQARDWAADALKEVFGQFTEPLGLKGLSDQGVDRVAADMKTAAEALAAARANQAQPLVGVMNVNGANDPMSTATAVVDQLAQRMVAVTARFRNGG